MPGRLTACLYTSQLQTTHGPILVQAPWPVPMVTIILTLQPSCLFSVRMTESSPSQSWINCTQHIKSIPLTTNQKSHRVFLLVICVADFVGRVIMNMYYKDQLFSVSSISFYFFSSYLHCQWASVEDLEKDKRIQQKIKRFKAKQGQNKFLSEV